MFSPDLTDSPPDWASLATELHCPLCEYNLRGLVEPRCPECGFAFTWAEILRGQCETHPYLFEHHRNRNVWSFWKTYWNDCRPRKFWNKLNPAQPVRVGRLMIYWAIASLGVFATVLTPFLRNLWDAFHDPSIVSIWRTAYSFPAITPSATITDKLHYAWNATTENISGVIAGSITILIWPWLTLLCLFIFVGSMHKANIRKRHLLRVIIYGTDYGLLMILPLAFIPINVGFGGSIFLAIACFALALYRLYFAYKLYLRFHLPFATVLSSQIMVFLVVIIVYLQASANNW